MDVNLAKWKGSAPFLHKCRCLASQKRPLTQGITEPADPFGPTSGASGARIPRFGGVPTSCEKRSQPRGGGSAPLASSARPQTWRETPGRSAEAAKHQGLPVKRQEVGR